MGICVVDWALTRPQTSPPTGWVVLVEHQQSRAEIGWIAQRNTPNTPEKLTNKLCCTTAERLYVTTITKWVWTVLKRTCVWITVKKKACNLSSFDYWSSQEVALVYCQLDLIKAPTLHIPLILISQKCKIKSRVLRTGLHCGKEIVLALCTVLMVTSPPGTKRHLCSWTKNMKPNVPGGTSLSLRICLT